MTSASFQEKIKVAHKLCRFLMTDCSHPELFGKCGCCEVYRLHTQKTEHPL